MSGGCSFGRSGAGMKTEVVYKLNGVDPEDGVESSFWALPPFRKQPLCPFSGVNESGVASR